jgi:uncharacterized protein (TIGR03067 family)
VVSESDYDLLPKDRRLAKVVVAKDRLTFVRQALETKCRMVRRLEKDPRELDLEVLEGPSKGQIMYGIYALNRDELTLAYNYRGRVGKRPTRFVSDGINGIRVVVLKRATR